ncbi:MAG: hypothetical protein J0J10_20090 [Bosea sp.]|uniref:hypothetical protein n=1 Tax=Bosea sp. (in: a-proteobacteria) TaxID=1871050 RepID=UPI001AD56C9E|nr:hypothetical protein [Bosea sp. (in: a-proteobacteria)]MBN9471073.1 hypothetical protein [Bosea sp. (in: a-proteobacteria)]
MNKTKQSPNRVCAGALGTVLCLCAFSSSAGELHVFEHNRSVMNLYMVSDKVRITYETPRPGLGEAGIRSGTVLFEGSYDGERFEGTAYAFKAGCRPAPYAVLGRSAGNGQIVLQGPAPVRAKHGCAVTGYSVESPHARLRFSHSATHH